MTETAPSPAPRPRRVRRLAAARLAALVLMSSGLAGCGSWFEPDVPAGRVSAEDVAYPNINEAPDRPSQLLTKEQQDAKEKEMQALGAQHVSTVKQVIETQDRRQ